MAGPSCDAIMAREGVVWRDRGHMTDALRYMIDYLYPIRQTVAPMPIKTWGHKTQVDHSYNTIRKF